MAIVVRELVIRARVDAEAAEPEAEAAPQGGASKAIVAECVDQVLEILREREER